MTVEELKEALKDVPDYYEVKFSDYCNVLHFKERNDKQSFMLFGSEGKSQCKKCCMDADDCMHYRSY